MGARCTLHAQRQEVEFCLGLLRTSRPAGVRASERDLHLARLEAIGETLRWLEAHEVEIRAFLALSPKVRATVLAHPHQVEFVQRQIDAAEQRAAAGGPVR